MSFSFNGKNSADFGIINVNTDSGMLEENFISERELNEITTRFSEKPYFQYIKKQPISFDLNFAFESVWDSTLIRQIVNWLNVDYYKEFYFIDDNLEKRIYYAIPIDDIKIIHNALRQGYLSLNFRCNSPYCYSDFITTEIYDLSLNTSIGTDIEITNSGDVNIKPQIWIEKISDDNGDIIITNTNTNQQSIFKTMARARNILTFTGIVSEGDTFSIGSNTYELDWNNSITEGNILVDLFYNAVPASNELLFTGNISDGETVQIGNYIYEFDTNNIITQGHIKVDVSTGLTPEIVIPLLTDVINNNVNEIVNADGVIQEDYKVVYIYAKIPGIIGNSITISTNCINASWYNNTLINGEDPEIDSVLTVLSDTINNKVGELVTTTPDLVNNKISFVSKTYGETSNTISTNTTCLNADFDSTTLLNGATGLIADENVYIDCEKEFIESDLSETYRYDAFNDNYLELVVNEVIDEENIETNTLNIKGKCKIKFKYQYKYLQNE